MDMDKNTIIGLLLIGLIIMLTYSDFYKKIAFKEAPPQKIENLRRQQSVPATTGKDTLAAKINKTPAEAAEVKEERQAQKRLQENIVKDFSLHVEKAEESLITIDTPLYHATVSSRGPSIQSWTLKKYMGPDSLPFQMIHEKYGNASLALPIQGDTLKLASFVFHSNASRSKFILDEAHPVAELPFELDLGDGKIVEQTLRFYYDKYSFDMDVKLEGLEKIVDGFAYGVDWDGSLNSSERYLTEDMHYTKAYALTANDIEEFDVKNKKIKIGGQDDWIIKWTAVRTKYFTVAVIPTSQAGNGVKFLGRTEEIAPKTLFKKYSVELHMPYLRRSQEDHFTVYIGPLQYSIVKSYHVQLERMMNFGWKIIRPISKLVLWCLTKLFIVIPNYGFVIIIFSILVKLVLFPLTKKSYQSMKEMQKLQPEMTKLREKYKDDPQKLNAEMMKLYREYGVNPVGGCLPMLLQMPLLYALFIVFRTTIELRGAPFIFWIKDLSAPDTIFNLPFKLPLYGSGVNVLPIIMGLTMFFQQKMTMKDPKQKAMVYFMPIFFTLLFNNFPSGLTLYYTLFNIFSVFQQKMIPEEKHLEKGKPAAKKKSKRPKSRLELMRQMRGK